MSQSVESALEEASQLVEMKTSSGSPAGSEARAAEAEAPEERSAPLPARSSQRVSDKTIILLIGGIALGSILCMVVIIFVLLAVRL
jgi:hypothetical protein